MGDGLVQVGKYDSAASRWAGVGPYYAMFPVAFADQVIASYTSPGQTVLDPFAGRATAIYSAATNGRFGLGCELNPVGWVYAQAKLHPATKDDVLARLDEIGRVAAGRRSHPPLPEFFDWCFAQDVRAFLSAARALLRWRRSRVDWTLAALLLVNMHGKRAASLSNQMRQTKSLSPEYAVNWWRERNLGPPEVDPVEFMRRRIEWRYAKGVPQTADSYVYLGDCTRRLPDIHQRVSRLDLPRPRLLITSPPYCGVTSYYYDQWLRLWLLGGEPNAQQPAGRHHGKFHDRAGYKRLLHDVFSRAKPILHRDAVVYVRTDHRAVTLDATIEVLRDVFPTKRLVRRRRPVEAKTQTHLFANRIVKSEEVDLILKPVTAF